MFKVSKNLQLSGLATALIVLLAGCVVEGPPVEHTEYVDRPVVQAPPPQPETVYVQPAPEMDSDTIYIDDSHRGHLHDYYYYPDAEIYFDPIGAYWFWLDGGSWVYGRDLPHRFHYDEHHRIFLHTDARHPYEVHDRFVRNIHEHHFDNRSGRPDVRDGRPDSRDSHPDMRDNHTGMHDNRDNHAGMHDNRPAPDFHDNHNDANHDGRPDVRGDAPRGGYAPAPQHGYYAPAPQGGYGVRGGDQGRQ